MAVTATPIYPQTIVTPVAQIALADASNLKTLYTAGANGSKIENILLTSTETANNRDIQFIVTVSAVDYVIGTVQCPLNSGFTNAVPIVSVLNHSQMYGLSTDAQGNKYLYLASGAVLKAKSLTTLASGKVISIFTQGGDF